MTILQALDQYYDRMAQRGEAPSPGWSAEMIGVVIVLSTVGDVVSVLEFSDNKGKQNRRELVPKWFGKQGTGSTPFFLWENTAYALGVSKKDAAKTGRDHAAFKDLHFSELTNEEDHALVALRRFLERWTPESFSPPLFHERMIDFNVAFRLDGDTKLIHQRPAALPYVDRFCTEEDDNLRHGICLVTGQQSKLVRLHAKIKGVDGAASAEVPLVSFNERAFESYGNEQAFNAPTSREAAFRYTTALNALLERQRRSNRLKIADATVVFWADAEKEEQAKAAEEVFSSIFEPPQGSAQDSDLARDIEEAAKLRDALQDFVAGRPVATPTLQLARGVRFHVLGLSPNAARLSVRFWVSDSFDAFAKRLAEHAADLTVEPKPWRNASPPSVQRLLVKSTAQQEKFENIPPLLAGEVTRAVLTGAPYPRTLMSAALMRLRAGDDPASGWHAAAIRAVLARLHRFGFESEEPPMALDPDNPNVAYQLGRLFAVYERAQEAALGRNLNATIRDKYYGAFSATPASVFALIDRGAQNHLAKVRKEAPGLYRWFEQSIGEIAGKIGSDFPRSLKMEDQGRFALGYYHQRWVKTEKPQSAEGQEGED